MAYLIRHPPGPLNIRTSVTPDQLTLIKAHLARLPETRSAEIERVKRLLPSYEIDPGEVANKMLGRVIGDMVR